MEIGLHHIEERHESSKRSKRSGDWNAFTNKTDRMNTQEKSGNVPNGPEESINWVNDVFKDIDRDNDRPDEPLFTSTKQKEVFNEIMATVNMEKPANRKDLKSLRRAWENFNGSGSVKSNGKGQWSVKGMKLSLQSYQVVGVGFLRRRENYTTSPRGGLNADVMGLGSKYAPKDA